MFIIAGVTYTGLACYAAGTVGSFRLLAAFLLAPLAPGLILAGRALDPFYFLIITPFSYLFALVGFPLYFLLRWLNWLRCWSIVALAARAGALVAFLFGFSHFDANGLPVDLSNASVFAFCGGATALVFWVIAYARRAA